MYISLAR